MPYDADGRWVPPSDTSGNWERRWEYTGDWEDDSDATVDFLYDVIQQGGEFISGESESQREESLANLYDTEAWRNLSTQQQAEVLQTYQNVYYDEWDTGQIIPGNPRHPRPDNETFSEDWGLGIQRTGEQTVQDRDQDNDWSPDQFIEDFAYGDIDYAHYNNDEAYQAAWQQLKGGNDPFTDDADKVALDYNNVGDIREAQEIINNWSDDERDEALEWSQQHHGTSNDMTELMQKYHQTYQFDPETNTVTRHDHLTGAQVGDPITHTPPPAPTSLNILTGNAPIPSYNEDGSRIATEADITHWYHQYLGREPDASGLDYWLNSGLSYQSIQDHISNSPEGQAAEEQGLGGSVFYNPQEYGTEASHNANKRPTPTPISAPNITIRNIGEPRKPTRHYMALSDTVWTDPSVDQRSTTRWDINTKQRNVVPGRQRRDAEFRTEGVTNPGLISDVGGND
tara:strand:+ start:64 stop:1428 length:1365 start_codon:yes stop_codon:yes gene_type:complete